MQTALIPRLYQYLCIMQHDLMNWKLSPSEIIQFLNFGRKLFHNPKLNSKKNLKYLAPFFTEVARLALDFYWNSWRFMLKICSAYEWNDLYLMELLPKISTKSEVFWKWHTPSKGGGSKYVFGPLHFDRRLS